jgi:ribosomal protein S18 acetylase RimI-like enzyme
MAVFTYEPALPPVAPDAFVQTIRLADEGKPVATATWSLPAIDAAVLQILTFEVAKDHRRHGHAKSLMTEMLRQGTLLCKSRKKKLRKAWILVRQKEQVVGRAFLTGQSFHHVATLPNLLKDEDGLVYVRAFD